MNGSTALIGLIALLAVTAAGVLVMTEVAQNQQQKGLAANAQMKDQGVTQSPDLAVVNIVGTNIEDDGVKYVRVQVRYDGQDTLNMSDTFIQLRTDKSITDLPYRNGTLNRSVATGFYTQ